MLPSCRVVSLAMSTLDSEQLEHSSLGGLSPKNGADISDEPVITTEPSEAAEAAYWTTNRRELWAFYLYYVVSFLRLFRPTLRSDKSDSREITAYLASTLVPHSSRTCSILPAMIQHILRFLYRAAAGQAVCFHILDGSETVRIVATEKLHPSY